MNDLHNLNRTMQTTHDALADQNAIKQCTKGRDWALTVSPEYKEDYCIELLDQSGSVVETVSPKKLKEKGVDTESIHDDLNDLVSFTKKLSEKINAPVYFHYSDDYDDFYRDDDNKSAFSGLKITAKRDDMSTVYLRYDDFIEPVGELVDTVTKKLKKQL